MHAVHDVGIPRTAERDDPPVTDPDVRLDDAPVVEDQGSGDDEIERTLGPRGPRLSHRLPDDLAAPEDDLVPAGTPVLLHLDQEIGVGQADPVAGRRPVQRA